MTTNLANTQSQVHTNTLEIALKTILHKNKDRLSHLSNHSHPRLLDDIAREITCQTLVYQRITDKIVHEMGSLHPLEEQLADEMQ